MRRLLTALTGLALGLMIALGGLSPAHAAFTFRLDGSSVGTIDFGSMDPGSAKFDLPTTGIFQLDCTSDQGNAYTVFVSDSQPFTNTADGTQTIGNENFRWLGTFTTGAGTLSKSAYVNFSTLPAAVYQGVAGDAGGATQVIQMKFGLIVPASLRGGTYTTTIRFTMTE